jgi:hypothetical protein
MLRGKKRGYDRWRMATSLSLSDGFYLTSLDQFERGFEMQEVIAWGFRIARRDTGLLIATDRQAFPRSVLRKRRLILLAGILLSMALFAVETHRLYIQSYGAGPQSATSVLSWIWALLWTGLPLLVSCWVLFQRKDVVKFSSSEVHIKWIQLRAFSSSKRYSRSEITKVQYVAESVPLSGSPGLLCLSIGNRQVNVLPGLKCVEAMLILEELEQLGFDVVRDPETVTRAELEGRRRPSLR